MVMACIAHIASMRPASWTMPVPSFIREVCAAIHASGVIASDPYASAVQTESYPSFSACLTSSIGKLHLGP